MTVKTLKITISIPWAQSLKDKRMVIKSIVTKIRNKFNVSIAEVEENDIHKTGVIGIACVTNNTSQADSICEHVICFLENHYEGPIVDIIADTY